jgi:hypothetical protein
MAAIRRGWQWQTFRAVAPVSGVRVSRQMFRLEHVGHL